MTSLKKILGGLFSLWKDLGTMLEADFVMDGDGAGAGHLQHNVTPSMVSENFEISRIFSFYSICQRK